MRVKHFKESLSQIMAFMLLTITCTMAQNSPDMIYPISGEAIECKITFINKINIFFKKAKRGKVGHIALVKVKDITLNTEDLYVLIGENELNKYPFLKNRIILEKVLKQERENKDNIIAQTSSDSSIKEMLIEIDKPVVKNKDQEPRLDFSFFTTQELKGMYKKAFENKDFDNVKLIQDELAIRDKALPAKEPYNLSRGSGDPLKGLNVARANQQMNIGNYYSLIIGINNYNGIWLPLKNAVHDAKALEDLLRSKYKFDHFNTLYNEFATRKNIMRELQWLVDNVKENDNVFIYYSGHGEFKNDLNKGYWVPVEAQTTETHEFIPNSDIQTYLSGIKSKHTLLISDACFSGDIFRGTTVSVPFDQTSIYYTKVHNLKSRQAFTSGGVEPVMDGGREGHSVFTYYLLEMLKRNERKYYDVGQLYHDMKIPVTNNSDQTPLLQPVKNTGDEGGQFIFIKK